MHCGPQHLLCHVRESCWSLSGRSLARSIVHSCIACFKVKLQVSNYLMGNLPKERVTQHHPFANTGCDYAGYFLIKDRKSRGFKLVKAYVCVFICLATKAINLELITSLDSEVFIAALKRFISLRGKPQSMYSDNGTTFLGANNEFRTFLKSNSPNFKNYLANEGVSWHFIPPRAPNFGGLREAGVKSLKFNLNMLLELHI